MTVDGVIAAVLVVLFVYFISTRAMRGSKASSDLSDPFLDEISRTKHKVDQQVKTATEAHEYELDARFSKDLELKRQLSEFAKKQELDQALIALWEEIEHYPSASNRLGVTEVDRSKEEKRKTVVFSYSGHRYAISCTERDNFHGDFYADFNLLEDGMEVFAILCSQHFSEYGTSYKFLDVKAFKKRGEWAKTLIHLRGLIQAEAKKRSAGHRYYGAEEIKKRFEE
jgi:hypothetical protein